MEFPRGYWLYEKSKHLWVSGYPVKSKLFKSPQDFGVHILWLLSSSQDRKDCCCVHCNVPSGGRDTPAVDDAVVSKPTASEEPRQINPAAPNAKIGSAIPASNSPVPGPNLQPRPQLQPLAAGPPAPGQPRLAPAPNGSIPQASPAAAHVPALTASLLYRTGELVWYTNGPSWRLGLISRSGDGMNQIAPIGHSCFQQPPVAKQDGELRPFHAFTVPPVTIPDLTGRAYDQVNWEVALKSLTPEQAKTHRDVILLDASKLAALKIDRSYSLFGKLSQQGNNASYHGIFLGAERIEIGDTLRVVIPNSLSPDAIIYFGIREIRSEELPTGRIVRFDGTYYQLHEGANAQTTTVPDDALPRALREESIWRRSVSPNQSLSWSMLHYDLLSEADIKGRFYPTHLLAPILQPQQFAKAVADGNRMAVTPALNGRLDSIAGGTANTGWRLNRLVTAGGSIPHDTVFWFEPQVREEVEAP